MITEGVRVEVDPRYAWRGRFGVVTQVGRYGTACVRMDGSGQLHRYFVRHLTVID